MDKYQIPLPQLGLNRIKAHLLRLEARIWKNPLPLKAEIALTMGGQSLTEAKLFQYTSIEEGHCFAKEGWDRVWFRIDAKPLRTWSESIESFENAYLEWIVNGETLLYGDDQPWHGLDTAHLRAPLPSLSDSEDYYYLCCGTYQTGQWMREGEPSLPAIEDGKLRFHKATVWEKDTFFWRMYHAADCLGQLIEKEINRWQGKNPSVGYQPPLRSVPPLLRHLLSDFDDAIDCFDLKKWDEYQQKITAIYSTYSSVDWENSVAIIGNSHIDLVWLWPESVSEEKTLHTCTTILRLMEKYDDFRFTFTQPEMLNRLKKGYPGVYKSIRERINQGCWEMTGAMEVEGDSLLPCGEGIARNFLMGQKKFKELNGKISEILWLPDAFGFSSCLPQIATQFGVKYFFTTKLLWSAIHDFPHGSFIWEGPDGSSLISHFARIGYEARGTVEELEKSAWTYPQAGVHNESLLAIGFGDGGGGVTEDQCERISNLRSLASLPKSSWRRADDFFAGLSKEKEHLPVHKGELYLEFHRGTYTTMAKMKSLYREIERALQIVEAAMIVSGRSLKIQNFWERLVFFQFHDALPGSSIELVYKQIFKEQLEILADLKRMTASCFPGISEDNTIVYWNPQGIPRRISFTVDIPETERKKKFVLRDSEGSLLAVQKGADGNFFSRSHFTGLSAGKFLLKEAGPGDSVPNSIRIDRDFLSNGIVSVCFDREARLCSLKIGDQEISLSGSASLVLLRDQPAEFEAWDIDQSTACLYATESISLIDFYPLEKGPLRGTMRAEGVIGSSPYTLDYILEENSTALKIRLTIDWKEEGFLLRYQIPTTYRDCGALYGTPFNSIRRPGYSSREGAQGLWEVPGSRWMALTDGLSRGLGIVCKDRFGFSLADGNVAISLLRSPLSSETNIPGAQGKYLDKGKHTIEFALMAHSDLNNEDSPSTAQSADLLYMDNIKINSVPDFVKGFDFIELGTLTLSWIKPAERGPGTVVRLHETAGASGITRIKVAEGRRVVQSDLKEEEHTELYADSEGVVSLSYKSYEIITLIIIGET